MSVTTIRSSANAAAPDSAMVAGSHGAEVAGATANEVACGVSKTTVRDPHLPVALDREGHRRDPLTAAEAGGLDHDRVVLPGQRRGEPDGAEVDGRDPVLEEREADLSLLTGGRRPSPPSMIVTSA